MTIIHLKKRDTHTFNFLYVQHCKIDNKDAFDHQTRSVGLIPSQQAQSSDPRIPHWLLFLPSCVCVGGGGVSAEAWSSLLWPGVTALLPDHLTHDPLSAACIAPRDVEGDGDRRRRGLPGWWSLWPISASLRACQTDKTGPCQIK